LARIEEALALARELSEPHGLAHAFFFAAILFQLRREQRMAQEYAEAAIAVTIEHGLSLYQATSTVALGWAFIEQGLTEQAIERIRHGLAAFEATGTELLRPHFLALLAEALDKAGHGAESLRVLEAALQVADRHGERYYEAELYRLKGELLLKHTTARAVSQAAMVGKNSVEVELLAVTNAEACFNRSIKIAQRQKAKSLELRAAMSSARLYQDQVRREEARGLLEQIYNRFTEGFDTTDLREAKALLTELS
jgi:predicted ATPase